MKTQTSPPAAMEYDNEAAAASRIGSRGDPERAVTTRVQVRFIRFPVFRLPVTFLAALWLAGCADSGEGNTSVPAPTPNDQCPDDPQKTDPGICGCGESDEDTDKDRTPDCIDECDSDPKKLKPGLCGCTVDEGACADFRPNLLFIMTDQQRFDALQRAQNELPHYGGSLKVRTPRLDRLASGGAYFRNAYSASPVCVPARGTLRTGCTIERTGLQANSLAEEEVYNRMSQFADKINALKSYEQLLVEKRGYVAETYGKWHLPTKLHYQSLSSQQVISYNDYDYATQTPQFSPDGSGDKIYKRALDHYAGLGVISKGFKDGQQENTYSNYPYTPTAIDARYGKPTNTPLTTEAGFESWETGQPYVNGKDSLSEDYTPSHFTGDMAVRALDRLARQDKPFALTVSFHNPHPPIVATPKYFDYYFNGRSNLFVPPSITDPMDNSAYEKSNGRLVALDAGYGFDNPAKVREWAAGYYALVEEIDTWVGRMLDKLEEHGIADKTLVIFTSDHGEMLGAHAMPGKNIFLEEAVHIPLIVALPGRIASNLTIQEPVGHIDVFATILDYLQAAQLDEGDGDSLRRFIEGTSYNENYDETAVISEWDFREPENATKLSRSLGGETNFMVRKGEYKLIMTKRRNSEHVDMLYDLADDRFEMKNLIGAMGATAPKEVIGKAEHLKVLLIEWMQRNDGSAGYYSDNKYNVGEGAGDIEEIRNRRQWRSLSYWQSDQTLEFGRAAWNGSAYVRNEYLYIGRTEPGTLKVSKISVAGKDAGYFSVDTTKGTISQNGHLRVKVTFRSPTRLASRTLSARIEIQNNAEGTSQVQIASKLFE